MAEETPNRIENRDATAIGQQPTVLVVDDDPALRRLLGRSLRSEYLVTEAVDGNDAWERLKEILPDLIISDVMMPNMNGYELCQLLKSDERTRLIPVILLTAKSDADSTVEGLLFGADDYVAKPFNIVELRARCANLIASRRFMREKFSREIVIGLSNIVIDSHDESFVRQLLACVEKHIGNTSLSVEWLAEDLNISRRHLTRRVEQTTGHSPAAIVRIMRLERASQLLLAHAASISEVAFAVGFKSSSHFCRAFRAQYGCSPSQYMKNREQ